MQSKLKNAASTAMECAGNIMLLAILIVLVGGLVGCQGLTPDALGIGPDDNAIQCIKASLDGYFTDSAASTGRIEFPANVELGTLTPELLDALSNLAQRLGC